MHFFDGYRENPEYALEACAPPRQRCGGRCSVTPTAACYPPWIGEIVTAAPGSHVALGIHCTQRH